MTQFAVLDALLAGAYDSGMPVKTVKEVGDFGIGCCEIAHVGATPARSAVTDPDRFRKAVLFVRPRDR
ncbi:acetolactate decarboxylase [Microbacterium sp. I2]|uniref:acetolactate decarboxylase n=1 Tax=Microbacterium sp. I2 TaxID=3391826 RepID=UPI003EDA845E